MIFVVGCAKNIPCAINYCEPIYGQANDWNVISDDLARAIYKHNMMCENF